MNYTARKSNNSLKCELVDMHNANVICEFEAVDTAMQNYNFDYVSGAIASSGQARTILTEHNFPVDVRSLVSKNVRISEKNGSTVTTNEYVVDAVGWWDDVRKGKTYGAPVRHVVITLV